MNFSSMFHMFFTHLTKFFIVLKAQGNANLSHSFCKCKQMFSNITMALQLMPSGRTVYPMQYNMHKQHWASCPQLQTWSWTHRVWLGRGRGRGRWLKSFCQGFPSGGYCLWGVWAIYYQLIVLHPLLACTHKKENEWQAKSQFWAEAKDTLTWRNNLHSEWQPNMV